MDREIRVDPAALRDFTKDLTSILNDVLQPGLERQKYLFTDPVTFGEHNPSGELFQRRTETSDAILAGHENLSKQIASFQFLIEAVGKIADGYQSADALSEGALQTVLQRTAGVVPGINTPAAASTGPAPSADSPPPPADVTPPAAGDPPTPSAGDPPADPVVTQDPVVEPEPVSVPESVPLDNDSMEPVKVVEG
ncbi:MAG: hypothetical protein HOU81_15095 [Hamadaea sp.]|uniref:hypothetical protein n=1 Tax=Hamadaea sp. TaxID=2024425 RepID=UPI0017B32A8C|nr:hypothetical protein [Hamadaea sp.]NUR72140.1 hypothetical protein [Hamadaea sp.]NUT21333.1 hypothetical protein [Hamadaea sp.]